MNGIVILDKDSGTFSRTAGWRVAKIFGEKKFGHIGTLDPMATGVLPIFIGNATKIIPFLEDLYPHKKEYLFGLRFGIQTDSLDITGNIIATDNKTPNNEDIITACKSLVGNIKQIPPMFSAVHINGQRAYDLARNGKNIDMPERNITIYELQFLSKTNNEYNFRVLCSRGTYVRAIVRDIAKICGTIATTTYINRTETSGFNIENAVKLDFLENLFNNNGDIKKYLISPDCALGDIPAINLTEKDAVFYKNGGFPRTDEEAGLKRVYHNKIFIGIGDVYDGCIHPKRTL